MKTEIENEYLRNLLEKVLAEYELLLSRYAKDVGAAEASTPATEELKEVLARPKIADSVLRLKKATTHELLDELRARIDVDYIDVTTMTDTETKLIEGVL